MTTVSHADVLIIGGGLIGSTVALALAAHDVTSIMVDTADLATTLNAGFDGRASAIASASARMLGAISVGPVLEAHGCAIRAIRVTDGTAPQFLHFDAGEGNEPLGIMLENRLLRAALMAAVEADERITLIAPAKVAGLVRGDHEATLTLAGTIIDNETFSSASHRLPV